MRMSCNGCRVLRKGCGDDCTIRPCLQWIKNPESQANATVFLAKFYGRAGLLNLLAAAPSDALRPAIFRSLLYESCGRVVNPIYGSVGLLWSGNWPKCQAAVEAVLKGKPIEQIPTTPQDLAAPPAPLKAYDIRHVARAAAAPAPAPAQPDPLRAVAKSGRPKFKRSSAAQKARPRRASAHHDDESSGSHAHVQELPGLGFAGEDVQDLDDDDDEQEMSVDAASHVSQREPSPSPAAVHENEREEEDAELDLTLGFGAPQQAEARAGAGRGSGEPRCGWAAEECDIGLALNLFNSSSSSSASSSPAPA